MKAASIPFGPVPIRVDMPPIVAPYAIPRSKASWKFSVSFSLKPLTVSFTTVITARPIGRSIIVVAVFITHILITAAVTMKPSIRDAPFDPALFRTNKAILLCRFHFWIAVAIRNPPRKR